VAKTPISGWQGGLGSRVGDFYDFLVNYTGYFYTLIYMGSYLFSYVTFKVDFVKQNYLVNSDDMILNFL